MDQPIIAVVGPTASGKTRRAVDLARHFGGEIVSADSRQVYRGMDIGTGKDLSDYGEIPYHLIDICDAGEKYNLFRFLTDASDAITSIRRRGCLPIVCGGTGLYVESLLKGMALPEVPENLPLRESLSHLSLDELTRRLAAMKTLHNVTDLDTPKRAIRAIEIQQWYVDHPDLAEGATNPRPIPAVTIGVDIDREARRRRITSRLDNRLAEGMTDEVRTLIKAGVNPDDLIYYGLEYKFVTLYVLGQLKLEEMRSQLEIAIHQFAKRQMTWLRGMERRGVPIHWLPWDMPADEFVGNVDAIYQEYCNSLAI